MNDSWSFTGCTTRPRPAWAQMMFASGCRFSRSRICRTMYGSWPGFGNGTSTSVWRMATRPVSAQKSKIRSSAGSSRLAVLPAIFDDTNSLWIVNSPMPENTPGNVISTRLMWSAAYMSAGLNPMIIGSKRACSAGVSALVPASPARRR